MHILDINEIVGSAFVKDYLRGEEKASKYFHTTVNDVEAFRERVDYLKSRAYNRLALVELLKEYHNQFEVSEKTYENIEALKDADTYVVISGQQAGLLTGPMYTMYKIITSIQLAKEQSAKLGVKVVPVFWVAGEDHDYLEVNHTYVEGNEGVVKKSYPLMNKKKKMISDVELDKQKCVKWIQDVFGTFGETEHTKDVLRLVERSLSKSKTFSQFFAQIILTLFKEEGLILIDSGYRPIRRLQIPYLQKIVGCHEDIAHALSNTQERLKEDGYNQSLNIKETAIHLFYEQDGERHLLYRDEHGGFVANDGRKVFTEESLLDEIGQHVSLFSNNVVTRPLMQEWLFPTIAFVGGPGELSYWGELKEVFEAVELKMPMVLPRLSFTIVERNVQQYLAQLDLRVDEVLSGNVKERKNQQVTSELTVSLDFLFNKMEKQLGVSYEELQNQLSVDFPHFQEYGMKNRDRMLKELALYKKVLERDLKLKHDVTLRKYDIVSNKLYPLDVPQERIFNVMYYLNLYGLDFLYQLTEKEISMNFQHKLIMM